MSCHHAGVHGSILAELQVALLDRPISVDMRVPVDVWHEVSHRRSSAYSGIASPLCFSASHAHCSGAVSHGLVSGEPYSRTRAIAGGWWPTRRRREGDVQPSSKYESHREPNGFLRLDVNVRRSSCPGKAPRREAAYFFLRSRLASQRNGLLGGRPPSRLRGCR
jgi:hypothetical protein